MNFNISLEKQHCGMMAANANQIREEMPDVFPVIQSCPAFGLPYLYDIKVHMLMPGQWPCIPNWHIDFCPRDENGEKRLDWIPKKLQPMYLLLSGPPFTEFEDGREVKPWEWTEFTQCDVHRGTRATEFGWRLFIRAAPRDIIPESAKKISGIRRHCQVYIEPDFEW